MGGWRRSADRTRLQANSLLTGNFTGNFAILVPCAPGSTQDTAVLQRFLAQFPKQIIREKISKNKEFLGRIREFDMQNGKRPFLAASEGITEFLPNVRKRRPSRDDGDGEFDRFFARVRKADRDCNIEPPASPYAIMRRVHPYRGENSGPGKDDRWRA